MIRKHSMDSVYSCEVQSHPALSGRKALFLWLVLLFVALAGGATLSAQNGLTVSPANATFSAVGGTIDLAVSAAADTAWTAESNGAWLTVVAGASGTGPGVVRVTAAVNESSEIRTAQVVIGPVTVFFVQEQLVAIVRFLPDAVTVGAQGALRTITVQVDPANLPWQATADVDWITVLTPQDVGSGSVSFVVATNPNPGIRIGTITAVGATLRVTQSGSAGTFSLSSTSASVPFSGGSGQVSVTSQPEDAAWVAYSLVPWISVSASQFTGSGMFSYTVELNPLGEARQGSISIAGVNFLVSQAANPDPVTPDPPEPTSTFQLSSGIISIAAPVSSTQEVSQSLAINSTGEALNFAVEVEGAPWLRARRTTGSTPDNIIFTADPTDLPVGTYFGTIRIRSTSNAAVVQIPARLRVNPPPGTPAQPIVSPASLFFSRIVGQPAPSIRTIRLGRPGEVLSASVSLASPVAWLQVFSNTTLDGTQITVAVQSINMLPGLYEAEVTVASPSSQFSEIRIPISYRVQLAPMGAPYISSGGIVNAASFGEGISPNTWISIFGSDLAKTSRTWASSDIQAGVLPTKLDGVEVTVGGNKAAISFVSSTQLNVLAPASSSLGRAEIVVTVDGQVSQSAVGYLTETLPAFFTFGPMSGKYAAAVHLDAAPVGPSDLFSTGTPARPAKAGEVIQIFGTGFGATNPPVDPSRLFQGAAPLVDFEGLEILVGGVKATVGFAGLSGTGLNQFNVTVPALDAGDHEVLAKIGNAYTKTGLFVRVQP